MTLPKISILMTAYNAERWVREALESVFASEGKKGAAPPSFEVVFVDDGSTDKTSLIAQEFVERFPEKMRHFQGLHLGRAQALIFARKQALGEYLGLVDADDILEKDALWRTAEILDAHPEAGFVATRCWRMSADGKELRPWRAGDCELTFEAMLQGHVAHHFRLMRSSAWDAVGGVEAEYVASIDYSLALKIAKRFPVLRLPRRLYRWRKHPQSMSSRLKSEQAAFAALAREAARETSNA